MVLSTTILRSLSFATILCLAEKKEHIVGTLLASIAVNCITYHLHKKNLISEGLKDTINYFSHGFAWGASGISFENLSKNNSTNKGVTEAFVYGFVPTLQMNFSMPIINYLCPTKPKQKESAPQIAEPSIYRMLPEYQTLISMMFKGMIKDYGLLQNLSNQAALLAKLATSIVSYILLEPMQLAPLSSYKTSALYIKALDRGIASFSASYFGSSSLQFTKVFPSPVRPYLFSVAYGVGSQLWTNVIINALTTKQTKADRVLAEKAKHEGKSL